MSLQFTGPPYTRHLGGNDTGQKAKDIAVVSVILIKPVYSFILRILLVSALRGNRRLEFFKVFKLCTDIISLHFTQPLSFLATAILLNNISLVMEC